MSSSGRRRLSDVHLAHLEPLAGQSSQCPLPSACWHVSARLLAPAGYPGALVGIHRRTWASQTRPQRLVHLFASSLRRLTGVAGDARGLHVQNRRTYIGPICWGYGIQKLPQSIPERLYLGNFARRQGDIFGCVSGQHTTPGDNALYGCVPAQRTARHKCLCRMCAGSTHSHGRRLVLVHASSRCILEKAVVCPLCDGPTHRRAGLNVPSVPRATTQPCLACLPLLMRALGIRWETCMQRYYAIKQDQLHTAEAHCRHWDGRALRELALRLRPAC